MAAATNSQCYFCGYSKHPRTQCPAKDAVCHGCGKTGHFSGVCQRKKSPKRDYRLKMCPAIHVKIPDGMGAIMESLTRAILKNQPNDICHYAVVHLESLLQMRLAQSSGLSPSPTEESAHKVPSCQETHTDDDLKNSVTDEKPLEEPESNDTSYGVEATAVRTLAASTGTVAILGTTAKVKELNEPAELDLTLSSTETAINDANEKISEVLALKYDSDITASSEVKDTVIDESDNARFSEKHWEEKNESRTKEDLRPLREENILEIRKEELEDKQEKGEEKEKVENNTEVRERTEAIAMKGNVDLSLLSIPVEIEIPVPVVETNPDSTNMLIAVEKEPARIVDYQEKMDLAHEPKIVEEMSVKKEENLDKVSHPQDIRLKKKEEFEKKSSIDLQEQKLAIEQMQNKIANNNVEHHKTTPESEPVSPEASKTEEDDEISSEQLKTNSLSEMSLSENLNSDGEEATRAASKALELKEIVASLSSSANCIAIDNEISENINQPKVVLKDDTTVNSNFHVSEELELCKAETSRAKDVLEDATEENGDKPFESNRLVSEHSSEKEPSTVSIPETSEETMSSSENSQGEKESNKLNADLADSSFYKTTGYDIQDKESNKLETEQQYFGDAIDKTQETAIQHQEKENQQNLIEMKQNLLTLDEIEEKTEVGEENLFKQKEDKIKNDETIVAETRKLGINEKKEQGEDYAETSSEESPKGKVQAKTDPKEFELQNFEKEIEVAEKPIVKKNTEMVAAATVIQSGFRGYQVRKHFKESGTPEEVKEISGQEICDEERQMCNGTITIAPEMLTEKGQSEEEENKLLAASESKTSENGEEEEVKRVPETLLKIAQAEVDKICKEAEKATESLMIPLEKDNSEIETQEFPAPPDELLTSENPSEKIKEDQSNSGTQSTEPTMPLGSNHTESDSSKTEDTTAPSLAESEMLKSAGHSPALQNGHFRLESSVTENINTEIAMQRDSTEGELTMEEDSTREDDDLAPTRSDIVCKADGENSLTPEEEKAATVIQAGYRGFKTRKRLRDEPSTRSDTGTVEQQYIKNESNYVKSSMKDKGESNSSISLPNDKSEKELNDSAKKIQAGVRGYLVRKKQKVERNAAVTIQSHFRGFKIRQRLKQKYT